MAEKLASHMLDYDEALTARDDANTSKARIKYIVTTMQYFKAMDKGMEQNK